MPVAAEIFRAVMRRVAQPVTVVTVSDADGLHGMTASSFTSIAVDPPLVMICVGEENATCGRIESAGAFAINVLGEEQEALGADFARPGSVKSEVLAAVPHSLAETGSPIFQESLCWLDCTVYAKHAAGNGVIFIGLVEAAGEGTAQLPLLYRNRAYEGHSPAEG